MSPVIDHICEPVNIAEKFADICKVACTPNSLERQAALKSQFEHNFGTYDCDHPGGFCVNVELVDKCIKCIRQGGLLSPALFAIHMDELIKRLKASKLGCCVSGIYHGCIVYADDIMLFSHSVQVMQRMLDLCESFSVDLDVKFNCAKSASMRIGPRYNCLCADLTLCDKALVYVSVVKYLGVYITAASSFKC